MPGTVGRRLFGTTPGARSGEIGQFVHSVDVMDGQGNIVSRERDELRFAAGASNLDDPVLLTAEFALTPEKPDVIVKRLRKAWIQRKASQPFSYQASGQLFKNPPGQVGRGPDREGGPRRHQGRRRPGQRARRQLLRRGAGLRDARRPSSHRAREGEGAGTLEGRSRAGDLDLVTLVRRTLIGVALAAAVLAAVIALGRWGREQLRDDPRYAITLDDIDFPSPPGMSRGDFLVGAPLPLSQGGTLLHDRSRSRCTYGNACSAQHPWVAHGRRDDRDRGRKRVHVELRFRKPALAVPTQGGGWRVVDDMGVLLPASASVEGLRKFVGTPKPPRAEAGTPWGDPEVERQAKASGR